MSQPNIPPTSEIGSSGIALPLWLINGILTDTEAAVSGEDGRRCEELVYHADVVLVILSLKFVSWLEKTKILIGKASQD